MSKNVLVTTLLAVLAAALYFFGRDSQREIGIRGLVIALLIVVTIVLTRVIRHAARRL
ncbi:MAG TPA: hypothetical protein VGM84_04325 [Steroidobacteraceae bacterium]|jgi:hypothetical protein